MRLFSFLILLVIGIISSGCLKVPTAEFTAFPPSPVVDQIVVLSNTSRDASRFEWDFGDGRGSEEKEPTISYAEPGEYTVTLTARHGLRSGSFHSVIVVRP